MNPWIALCAWPVISAMFYRNWSVASATAATLIGATLLLPESISFDLPLLPALNKGTIAIFCALFFVWLASRNPIKASGMMPGWLPRDRVSRVLLALIIIGAFGTALTNTDSISIGAARLPGMRVYDGFSLSLTAITFLIPFLLARKIMATPDGQRSLLMVLIIAASAYCFLALWEVRMSPRLNVHVYGFFPHSWHQHIRGGGFRPLVFMGHGLKLGILLAVAAIAAIGLARIEKGPTKSKLIAAFMLLLITIFLSKVLGAFAITLVLVAVVFLAPRHVQIPVLMGIAILVLSFPIMRNTELVPTDRLVNIAERIDPARAQSLEFRFDNEDILLDRARERPVFGWGGWGRNRVYNERGEDISITDGRWVILFGQGGWARYIGELGLLCWSILAICLRRDKIDGVSVVLMCGLAANLIDLLPNSGVSPLTWMMAGALIGRLEYSADETETEPQLAGRKQTKYVREKTPALRPEPVPPRAQGKPVYSRQAGVQHTRARPALKREKPTYGR